MPSPLRFRPRWNTTTLISLCTWACIAAAQPASTSADATAEAEIVRSAQLWISKNRTDLARQHIEKLLLVQPNSAWGHATLGDIALREGKAAEARTQLEWLRTHAPQHPATRELNLLARLFGPDSQKLATMRLMAQAGRLQEAATIARNLFPDGPPASGALALEYFQIIGNAAPAADPEIDRTLQQQYARTGDVHYRILALQRQLSRSAPTQAMLAEIAQLTQHPGADEQAVRGLWRWAIDKLPWDATPAAAQAYLRRYPQDTAMLQQLDKARAAVAEQQRIANSPANVAKRAADQALARNDLPAAEAAFRTALRTAPRDADAMGGLGLVAMRQGQHAEAEQRFSQALAWDGATKWRQLRDTARLWGALRQGDDALQAGDTATAMAMASKALAMQPNNPDALGLRAQTLQAQGATAQAEQAWLDLLHRDPSHMPAVRALVQMYLAQKRLHEAEALLSQLPARAQSDSAALRADLLQAQADVALAQKRPAQAMEALEAALPLAPDDAWLRHRLARLYLEQGQPTLAQSVMHDGVQRYPTQPSMRQASALVWLAQDRPDAALADMQAIPSAELSPAQKELLQNTKLQSLVAHAREAKNTETRQQLLTQAEALTGPDADAARQVANAWFDANQPDQALGVWQRFRQQHPSTPAIDLSYAQALDRSRADAPLAQLLPTLMARSDWSAADNAALLDLQASTLERRIRALYAQGKHNAARALADTAPLHKGPGIGTGQHAAARARLYMAAEDSESALPLLQQALADTPNDFDLQVETGNAWVLSGDRAQALPHAQAAQAVAANQAVWRQLALVRLWQRMGRMDEAQSLLDTVARAPDVDRSDVLLHSARLQRAQRHYAQAASLFGDALAELPDAPAAQRLGIEEERQSIEARRQAWVETGMLRLKKTGTNGISTLNGWEIPAVAWIPRDYDGPQFVHVDRVLLNAGRLDSIPSDFFDNGDITSLPDVARFGQVGAVAVTAQAAGQGADFLQRYNDSRWRQQSARGYNVGTGHDGDDFGWDIGLTGIGMPVTNLVGGLRWSLPSTQDTSWSLRLQRRPVTGSLLSYAGARDPATGQTWGGVVLNSATVSTSRDTRSGWALSASAGWGLYTGKNVANNTRVQARLSAGRDVWRSPWQRLYAGVSLTATAHQRDLSEYSWGHGGYYSPKRSVSLALPVEWTGREGAWAWRLQGSVSVSQTASSTSPLYPKPVNIPPAWRAAEQQLGYSSSGGFGTGWSFNATVERQITQNLALGAHLSLDRSEYYAPTNIMVYARFFFDPVRAPLVNYPRPVTPYSQF